MSIREQEEKEMEREEKEIQQNNISPFMRNSIHATHGNSQRKKPINSLIQLWTAYELHKQTTRHNKPKSNNTFVLHLGGIFCTFYWIYKFHYNSIVNLFESGLLLVGRLFIIVSISLFL